MLLSNSTFLQENALPENCYLRVLPIAIFPVIENYLAAKEYNLFMNSSRTLFKDIKPQIFNISENGMKPEDYKHNLNDKNALFELRFDQFFVMRKQLEEDGRLHLLRLLIHKAPENILLKYASFFANIYQIRVRLPVSVSGDFDFSIFNKINTVRLDGFTSVNKITKGLENIQHLSIFDFPDLVSIDCSWVGLDSLVIVGCQKLTNIQSLQGIKEIQVQRCYWLKLNLSNTKDSLRRLTYEEIPSADIRLNMIPCESLQYLKLSPFIKLPEDDFNMLINIPHLEIAADYSTQSEFPFFYGNYLSLQNFCLSSWTKTVRFDHLLSLSLHICIGCMELPIFPHLMTLHLSFLHELEEIRSESLPKCTRLVITSCSNLRVIHQLSNIKEIEMSNCNQFEEFMNFHEISSLKRIFLIHLSSFSKMSCLRNIADITIYKCDNIPLNFDGFDQSCLLKEQRKIIFGECKMSTNLKGLGNIGNLEFRGGSGLIDGQGIHNIDHLILKYVNSLTSFLSFHHIKRISVYHHHVDKLISFDGLQNVPIIYFSLHPETRTTTTTTNNHSFILSPFAFNTTTIKSIPDVPQISLEGLRGCGQVYFHEDFMIAKEAKKYVIDHSFTSYAEIFDTIKEFYVLSSNRSIGCTNNNPSTQDFLEEKTRLW